MGHLPLESEGLINWFRSLLKYTPPAAHDEVTAEIVQLTLLRHCDASIMRAPGFYWSLCAVVCLSRLDPTRVCSASHRPFACPLLALQRHHEASSACPLAGVKAVVSQTPAEVRV